MDNYPINDELAAAKKVMTAFVAALKNYALYPPEHTICRQSVAGAFTCLDAFLNDHFAFRLDIEKDSILYQEEVIHHGEHSEMDLAFLLFRDGIRWIEFEKGFERSGMESFFNLLNNHRNPLEQTEGDLVSALWEADLDHLRYKAVDIYWEGEPIIDFSQLNAKENDEDGIESVDDAKDELVQAALASKSNTSVELTSEEMIKLKEMINQDEDLDRTDNILDIVLVIMLNDPSQDHFEDELKFLREALKETLLQEKFQYAHKLLASLRKIRQFCETKKPWAVPLLGNFFVSISTPQFLSVLLKIGPRLDPNQLKLLRKTLLLLPPEAISGLGPILLEMRSPDIEHQMNDVVKFLANQDLRPLENLLNSPEEPLVRKLVYILGQLADPKSTEVLLKMVRHPSDTVREQVLKALLTRDPQIVEKLFAFIEDDSEVIRQLMIHHLGKRRSELAENLMLGYLEKGNHQYRDREHVMACYRILGRCGSTQSVPFLKKALLDKGWLPGMTRSTHRQGAALALAELGLKESETALSQASRSLVPSVRYACRKALELK